MGQGVVKLLSKIAKKVVENAPKILAGTSIALSIGAVGFAIKGTVLAVRIEDERQEKIKNGELPVPEHPRWETFKAVWKCYIPSATMLIASAGCSIYGTDIATSRTAIATAACKLTEAAFDDYRAEVREQIGEDKEKEIGRSIAQKKAEEQQMLATEPPKTYVVSPYEEVLIQEKYTGEVIRSDINSIKEVINNINYRLSHSYIDYISLMEYADEIGCQDCHDEKLGWSGAHCLLEPRFELGTCRGQPCFVLSMQTDPYENYNKYG